MRTCEACGREYRSPRDATCPWCGFNNGPGRRPRTARTVRRTEKRRRHFAWNEGCTDDA